MNVMHRSSPRRLRHAAAAVITAVLMAGAALARAATPEPSTHAGIWKAAVPRHHVDAQFGGLDPLGLAAGARIQADCSLNWVDPDDGQRYCFASGTSLQYFLDAPRASLARAWRQWSRLRPAD